MSKVSLVVTTKNEGSSIACLIESILSQTLVPDEVIFVDSNSTDETRDIINLAKKNTPLNIRLFVKDTNRSQGRNLAIRKAKHEVIAATDSGCVLDRHWLERITKPLLEDKADSVAGFYLAVAPTFLSKSLAPFVATMPSKFDSSSFLPSSRSIAFTKFAWEKIGHYPEHLKYCEDLVFARALDENTRLLRVKNALVYWRVDTPMEAFFHQIQHYAQGDVEANYIPHLVKHISVFLRYPVFLIAPFLFPIYLVFAIYKNYPHVRHPTAFFYLPIIQLVTDAAIMSGSLKGLINVYRDQSNLRLTSSISLP